MSEAGAEAADATVGFQQRRPSVLPTGRLRSKGAGEARWKAPAPFPEVPHGPRAQQHLADGAGGPEAGTLRCDRGSQRCRHPVSPRQTPWRPPPPGGGRVDLPPSQTASARGGGHRLPWPPPLLPTSSFHSLAGRVLPPPGPGCTRPSAGHLVVSLRPP